MKTRSTAWWDQCNHPYFPEEEFRRAFKMSKATFDLICSELDPVVTKKDTMLRLAIPVRQRVAVCIWRLATGEPLRLVSKRFGLGISTCQKLVLEVCTAIKGVLMTKYLQWPDEERMMEIKNEFESVSGIQNVGGSMYTTHVPIIAPKVNGPAYFKKRHTERNQKTSYSITVQGVVDSKGIFTDVCIGWPGSMTDDKILEKSALSQRANRGLLKDVWIVGNSGYPLLDWVLVPYAQQNFWSQSVFNEKTREVQRVAKEAFSRLKGRWSCLQKRTEVRLQELPVVLGACCVLHNICEMRNESMVGTEMVNFQLVDDEVVPENNVRSVGAMRARDQIACHLLHHNSAATGLPSLAPSRQMEMMNFDLVDDEVVPENNMRSVGAMRARDQIAAQSAFLVFDEEEKSPATNEDHNQIEGFFPELEQEVDQIRSEGGRSSTGSISNISDVSTHLSGGGGARRLWLENRSESWWDHCNHPDFPEKEFRGAFRMSKATFDLICGELDHVIMTKDTMIRLTIPVRQCVAVFIWSLASGEPLHFVSERFRLGIPTCHELVLEVCSAIKSVLMSKYLQWPDEEKMKEIKSEFESVSGIPNVGGSMYTTHVPITDPIVNSLAYINKRHTERNQDSAYSIAVQGVVDSKGIFTNVCIRWARSMTEGTILEKSDLPLRANRGLLKNVWIVGSSGYPLLDWLLVPYAQQNLPTQRFFNEKMGKVQRVAEEAFSRLKGRWSCLQNITEVKLQDLPDIIGACFVLHNICEMRNEGMDQMVMNISLVDDEVVPENYVRLATVGAIRAREQIAHHLFTATDLH